MSKKLPAIRLHGNQVAGMRHIKRGLYELFKTEDLAKRMGAPVYKRSVEVSQYTSITTEIHKDQTFVHIYSNPPQLPEQLAVEEEEEKKVWQCPSAFLIRGPERAPVPTTGGEYELPPGYLIGYNYREQRWERVTYRGADGQIVDVDCGNVGWYHVRDNAGLGYYNRCDVVTWRGPNNPFPLSPTVWDDASLSDEDRRNIVFGPFVYFQGRRVNAPCAHVLGACIKEGLDDNNELKTFMYVHGGEVTEDDPIDRYPRWFEDKCWRTPIGEFMSQVNPTWEPVWTLSFTDVVNQGTVTDGFPGVSYWAPCPQSTDYIDEDGFIYYIRCYASDNNVQGKTVFFKVNCLDGTYEVLNSSEQSAPTLRYATSGKNYDYFTLFNTSHKVTKQNAEEALIVAAETSYSNVGKPWIFYVYSGTQDLYTLGLEHSYRSFSSYSQPADDTPSSDYDVIEPYSTYMQGHTDVHVYKNGKRIRTFRVIDLLNSSSSFDTRTLAGRPNTTTWESVNTNWFTREIMDYHPEIADSYTAIEASCQYSDPNAVASLNLNLIDRNRNRGIVGNSSVFNATIPDGDRSLWYHEVWVAPGRVHAWELGEQAPADVTETVSFKWSISSGYSGYLEIEAINGQYPDSIWPEGSPVSNLNMPASVYLGGTKLSTRIGHKMQGMDWDAEARVYGDALLWHLKRKVESDPQVLSKDINVPCYAIHRPVDGANGAKPYLQLRTKIHKNSGFQAWPEPFHGDWHNIGYADEDPGQVNDNEIWEKYQTFGLGVFGHDNIPLWVHPPGSVQSPDDPDGEEEPHYNDFEWELFSNFTDAKELNNIFKEDDNIFFGIGII